MIGATAIPGLASRIAAVTAILSNLLVAIVLADSAGPAPWDEDRALAMFRGPAAADTIGLTPVWSLAVKDSGRRVVIVTNRFRDSPSRVRFPLDSIELRRCTVRGGGEGEEFVMYEDIAVVPVRPNGELDSMEILWQRLHVGPEDEPRHFAGIGPIPRDGSRYCLSGNGKWLLALRRRPHGVNVQGETGAFGLLDYFDVSNPKRPRRIGATLEADGRLDNGAVSDDGSRVAVGITPEGTAGWFGAKVVAFERLGGSLSAPRLVVPSTTAEGLRIDGRYLFVGLQRPPLPTVVVFSTTESISLYDLGK